MKENLQDLGTAPIGKLLLRMAAPMVLAQVVNLLYNIVDRIFIGHIPEIGRFALTGVGLCFPVITIIGAFYMLIAQGGAPLAAIEMGRGDLCRAEAYLGGCFSCLLVTAALLTVGFSVWGEGLLWLFGASSDTIGFALSYMRIYAAGSVCVMVGMGMNLFITTQGFATYSMISVVIGAAANILLDPLFIFVFNWGVKGAALATVLSQALSAAFVLAFLLGRKTRLKLRPENLRPKRALMGKALALGLAPFVMQATEAAVNISFNSSLQRFGGDIAVGAMTIASTVMQMISLPVQGIGQGAQPIISFNYGAQNTARVRKVARLTFVVIESAVFFSWAAIELFPAFFIRLFNSDAALLDTAVWTLRLYLATFGLFGLQSAAQQVFVATGKAKQSLFVALLRKVILLIPLIHLLPKLFSDPVFAVFLAEPVADFLSVSTCSILFFFTFRKDMARLEQASPARLQR